MAARAQELADSSANDGKENQTSEHSELHTSCRDNTDASNHVGA